MAGALGAVARRLARSAAYERRGRRLGSAAAPALARRPRRRVSSSSRAAGEDFVLGACLGWMITLCVFPVGKVFLDKQADVRREEAENVFLRAKSQEMDEEIARLEMAWEEEVAARQKKREQ